MSFEIHELPTSDFPCGLQEIPEPPKQLLYRGALPPPDIKLLSVVGSRNYTSYGKQVIDYLIDGLRGYNIGIVSGLALGIDSLAHEAALRNNLYTLAIPGGGIADTAIYPAKHKPLARKILESGGGMLSEYEPNFKAAKWSFAKRNRLVCGISRATLLIEAGEKSGTLITARLAADYNRELLVVPGSIFSKQHDGIHQFLKLGATPVTCPADILEILHIDTKHASEQSTKPSQLTLTTEQQQVLAALHEPLSRDELIRTLGIPTEKATQLLMFMEMDGLVVMSAGMYRCAR